MRAREWRLACVLCASLASGLPACAPEDPAPLEAERAKLLSDTVPRDEYWREVERKGTALREQRSAEQRSARATAERAQVAASLEQLRALVADAQRVNAEVVTQIDALTQQTEKLRARGRSLESFLANTGPPDVGARAP
jgi:hypothetical protein